MARGVLGFVALLSFCMLGVTLAQQRAYLILFFGGLTVFCTFVLLMYKETKMPDFIENEDLYEEAVIKQQIQRERRPRVIAKKGGLTLFKGDKDHES